VAEVRLSQADLSLRVYETSTLTADLRDKNGNALTGRSVSWRSSNAGIAGVSANGIVTGVSAGSATITATSEGKSAIAEVTVSPAPVTTATIVPATSVLNAGESRSLSVALKDQNGILLSDRVVSWTTSNSAIAAVSETGTVTGVAIGSATITATSEGKSGTATVTVAGVPVASVTLVPGTLSLIAGKSGNLSAEIRDQAGNLLTGRAISWSTSNATVATVSTGGSVSAVAAGAATISATSEGKTGTATVTVSAPVTTVVVIPANVSLEVGQSTTLRAEVRDQSGKLIDRPVLWSSSNSGIAAVSSAGTVDAAAVGTANITATSEGISGTATITVAPPVIRDCATITKPGNYRVISDLKPQVTGLNCLTFENTADVSIDCEGHTIYGMNATDVTRLQIRRCTVESGDPSSAGALSFFGTGLTELTIDGNQFRHGLVVNGAQGSITNNTVTGLGLTIVGTTGVDISGNLIEFHPGQPPYAMFAAGIWIEDGKGDRISGNTIDGGWDGNVDNWGTYGADDGIVLFNEKSVTVENNVIRNVWDAGIESTGTLASSIITNNTITNTVIGIGAWWDAHLSYNYYTNNTVSRASSLVTFYFAQNGTSKTPCLFSDNQFVNNRLVEPVNRGVRSSFTGFAFQDSCTVERNNLQGNDFGGQSLVLFPESGFNR
jgi:parallel beta-helix repeat protein